MGDGESPGVGRSPVGVSLFRTMAAERGGSTFAIFSTSFSYGECCEASMVVDGLTTSAVTGKGLLKGSAGGRLSFSNLALAAANGFPVIFVWSVGGSGLECALW